ncbi:MAG: hypothetical protein M1832_001483 [Thelocarpon impressellum]|nr:MAG: hypothetical protein M1832_001483 [Thelocarpon impressellum]
MNDPSGGVPPALLQHVHLLSNFRFPTVAHMSVEAIVDYLLQAPNITRHAAPMNWTYLDAPADGTVLLVWQAPQLGTHFASDGYVWADPEQAFSLDAKGYTVEMYVHRSGYHPPHESLATHCRRRYRLTASKSPSPNVSIDPSLWLVHYAACEEAARVPANRIPLAPQTQQVLTARRFLQTQGQLVRKEFMLHDRGNWPSINLPGGQMPGYAQQPGAMYPTPPHQGGRPLQQASPYYPPQQQQQQQQHPQPGMGPSPAKRPRQTPPTHMPGSGMAPAAMNAAHETYFDDEEDTSRGDLLDHLTPREIAMVRYRQHHEWMEEVMSSPYSINQIIPVDLGLEMKGVLEDLTKGIFDAPAGERSENGASVLPRVGKLREGKLEDFQQRVEAYQAKTKAEMERSEKDHRRRMAKLGERSRRFRDWELRLREAETDPTDTGTEAWRLEGLLENLDEADENATSTRKPREKVDDIVTQVETYVGKRVVEIPEVMCAQTGGLQDNPTEEGGVPKDFVYPHAAVDGADEEPTNEATGNGDVEMNNSAAGLLDQFGMSETSTPAAAAAPSPAKGVPAVGGAPAAAATVAPAAPEAVSAAPGTATEAAEAATPQPADLDVDVEMGGVPNDHADTSAPTVPDGNDWVMVENATSPAGGAAPVASTAPDAALETEAAAQADPVATTADALATLGEEGDALDLTDVIAAEDGFGLEDSAFGDAFLGTESAGDGGVGGEGVTEGGEGGEKQ